MTLGVDCSAMYADDGKQRCMPNANNAAYASSYYADATCARPLAFRIKGCEGTPKYATEGVEGACPYGWRMWPVTGRHIGPIYVKGDGTKCTSTTSASLDYFDLGAALPASTFVEFSEVLE